LHVITGIAWVGASFYFVWLDNHLYKLKAKETQDKGVDGELWAVHGGGFYNPQKYMVAPKELPHGLHWFYWESYSTWILAVGVIVSTMVVFVSWLTCHLFSARAAFLITGAMMATAMTANVDGLPLGGGSESLGSSWAGHVRFSAGPGTKKSLQA
jgi:uncharacterized membrane protein